MRKNSQRLLVKLNSIRQPTLETVKKLMKAIREVDPNAKADDFFDI
jgi:hypothetical protein